MRPAWTFTIVGASAVVVAVLALGKADLPPERAIEHAGSAAAGLGFDLAKVEPPHASGSSFWGTRSFHWEIPEKGGAVNRLTYLVNDERLCWSSIGRSGAVDHGCVVVKAPT
jgi:hypothetical protein